jgi:hypothetical protein
MATSRCSVLTYSSFSRSASDSAASVTRRSRIRVHLPDDLRRDAFALLEQRQEQVLRRDLRVSLAVGELLGGEDRLLGLLGVLVDVHDRASSFDNAS